MDDLLSSTDSEESDSSVSSSLDDNDNDYTRYNGGIRRSPVCREHPPINPLCEYTTFTINLRYTTPQAFNVSLFRTAMIRVGQT